MSLVKSTNTRKNREGGTGQLDSHRRCCGSSSASSSLSCRDITSCHHSSFTNYNYSLCQAFTACQGLTQRPGCCQTLSGFLWYSLLSSPAGNTEQKEDRSFTNAEIFFKTIMTMHSGTSGKPKTIYNVKSYFIDAIINNVVLILYNWKRHF